MIATCASREIVMSLGLWAESDLFPIYPQHIFPACSHRSLVARTTCHEDRSKNIDVYTAAAICYHERLIKKKTLLNGYKRSDLSMRFIQ